MNQLKSLTRIQAGNGGKRRKKVKCITFGGIRHNHGHHRQQERLDEVRGYCVDQFSPIAGARLLSMQSLSKIGGTWKPQFF